jgi:signal transduction histidine kinase
MSQVGAAMDNLQDVQVFQNLLQVSRQFAENRELQAVLDYTVDVTLDLLKAERGYLILMDDTGSLDFRVRRVIKGIDLSAPGEEISQTILKQTLEQQRPMLVSNALDDPRLNEAVSVKALDLRSVMCVPLKSHGELIGALYVENRSIENLFEEQHLEILEHLASQAAVSIVNARLNDNLEAQVTARTAELLQANQHLEQEIIERENAEAEIIRLAVEYERAEVLSRFMHDASHEFRTPLSIIQTNLALITRDRESTHTERYITRAEHNIQAIVELLDKMLEMIRLDSNELQVWNPVNLHTLIQQTVQVQQDRSGTDRIQVRAELEGDSLRIAGDAVEITSAIVELLKNAVKFSPPGGEVIVRAYREAAIAIIEVIDRGTGIPPEHMPRIFDRFFRADEAHTTRGFGLGLSIVKRIVERHAGVLKVESVVDRGSTFRILKAFDLITSPAFVLVKAADRFQHPTQRVNELWQTDFSQFKVVGWGYYYLSTVLDDFSRYIIAWKLTTGMSHTDVEDTLDLAIAATGVKQVAVQHRPRLLRDNGSAYISGDLADYLAQHGIQHTHGAPYHPQTQGKIERYHRSIKNVICLEHHYFPWQLEQAIGAFVEHYNQGTRQCDTPADMFFGRAAQVEDARAAVKRRTLSQRRTQHLLAQSSV